MKSSLCLSPEQQGQALRRKFEELTFPMMDKLFNTALKMTRDSWDAEDLMQETYLKAYRAFHRFQLGTNFHAWMYRILINAFINRYRKKQRHPIETNIETVPVSSFDEEFRQPLKVPAGNPEYDADEFDDVVALALEQLPSHYRIVVILSDVNELKYKEIAQTLGCPLGTVMSRLSRGRKMLAALLKGYAVENGFY